MSNPLEETYESLRPLVFSVAYRMLGSVSEAEDVVQETLLLMHVVAGRRDELASRFFAACEERDVPAFIDMPAADVVFTGDGGGKVPPGLAISRPVFGRERVGRLLAGFSKRLEGLLLGSLPA